MKIIHCFRSPVGGIFRHVRDLLAEQTKAGHSVGFICDASTGGAYEDALFEKVRPSLALGLHRLPMARSISPKDPITLLAIRKLIRKIGPDVVHSHSAKGGVYGRLGAVMASSASRPIAAFYCPHGGAMHYDRASLKGKVYFAAERILERYTDSLIFISGYEQNAYHEKVGTPQCPETVVYNGLPEAEFSAVGTTAEATDFLYIGMMRDLKGPDIFIEAFRIAREKSGKNLTAMFVGDGEDKDRYIRTIKAHGLSEVVSIHSAMPAREAFAKARIVVVPSRAESLPYLVLEAMAAEKPIVST
ncbi:MAG: glycosyltransferase, partial [Pseudomonadota bacterium]